PFDTFLATFWTERHSSRRSIGEVRLAPRFGPSPGGQGTNGWFSSLSLAQSIVATLSTPPNRGCSRVGCASGAPPAQKKGRRKNETADEHDREPDQAAWASR